MASFAPIARGVRGRCPNCGEANVLAGVWEIQDQCPACRYSFVREDGYWVGAMTVLMGMVILGFFVTFATAVALTWPDPPWTQIGIGTAMLNGLISFLAYSWAKTIWVGIDLGFNPPTTVEEAEMATRRAAAEGEDPAARD